MKKSDAKVTTAGGSATTIEKKRGARGPGKARKEIEVVTLSLSKQAANDLTLLASKLGQTKTAIAEKAILLLKSFTFNTTTPTSFFDVQELSKDHILVPFEMYSKVSKMSIPLLTQKEDAGEIKTLRSGELKYVVLGDKDQFAIYFSLVEVSSLTAALIRQNEEIQQRLKAVEDKVDTI